MLSAGDDVSIAFIEALVSIGGDADVSVGAFASVGDDDVIVAKDGDGDVTVSIDAFASVGDDDAIMVTGVALSVGDDDVILLTGSGDLIFVLVEEGMASVAELLIRVRIPARENLWNGLVKDSIVETDEEGDEGEEEGEEETDEGRGGGEGKWRLKSCGESERRRP